MLELQKYFKRVFFINAHLSPQLKVVLERLNQAEIISIQTSNQEILMPVEMT